MQNFVASITSITGFNRLNIELTLKQTLVASKIRKKMLFKYYNSTKERVYSMTGIIFFDFYERIQREHLNSV